MRLLRGNHAALLLQVRTPLLLQASSWHAAAAGQPQSAAAHLAERVGQVEVAERPAALVGIWRPSELNEPAWRRGVSGCSGSTAAAAGLPVSSGARMAKRWGERCDPPLGQDGGTALRLLCQLFHASKNLLRRWLRHI